MNHYQAVSTHVALHNTNTTTHTADPKLHEDFLHIALILQLKSLP